MLQSSWVEIGDGVSESVCELPFYRPQRVHRLPSAQMGAVVAGADIGGLPGLGVVPPHPAEPKGARVGAGLGAHFSVRPIGGGAGLRAGVHVPGFDDVAQGVRHEERLHAASVFAHDLPVDGGVVYNWHGRPFRKLPLLLRHSAIP